ncbi:MAG TPA: hypothetical protein VLH08_05880, partial [Acidobacteriota bacterium]|nr:hypothetical protein [Acidobacteriota bacterium]
MKINPNQTRALDRILDNQFGSGTSIITEGSSVKLLPGEKDTILISQLGNRLQILVNGSEKFLLTERESKNFKIQGDQSNVTFDPSVSLYSYQKNPIPASESPALPKIPTERGDQLGHARRVESSFETAVTRRVITEDLKEDAFINHIGKQMQRFISETGNTPQQISFRTQKDLLPYLTQLDQITSSPKAFGSVPKDLNVTLRRSAQEIQGGRSIELEMLAGQINGGLKQMIDSKSSSSELQPGRIPFEAREIPPGETQLGTLQKAEMINEALSKHDIDKIREFAGDSSFLKLTLPTEKAAFVNIFAKHAAASETVPAEMMLDRQNIMQVLQSAQNDQEFRSILKSVGLSKVQQLFNDAPLEFNIAAHAFQSPDLQIPSNFSVGQYIKGFNPHEIFNTRNLIQQHHLRLAEDAVKFSENPLFLAIASPEEKVSLIQALRSGYVSTSENRAIINILQSAMDKTEFNEIVDSAGGKAISLSLQDPLSLLQWNRLAGAYDRMDLTTDFVEGVKYSEALLQPFPFDGDLALSLSPLIAGPILRQHSVADIAKLLDGFMSDAANWIGNQINVLERGAYVQAGLENLNRMMHELPMFDVGIMRNQLHSILQQPLIHSQQILKLLQTFISPAGLTEF